MNIREMLTSAASRYARRLALRAALGGIAAVGVGFRAYATADGGEPDVDSPAVVAAAGETAARPAAPAVPAPTVPAASPATVATADSAALAAADTSVRGPSDSTALALAAMGRESFTYGGQGRRDPFASLIKIGGDLRPLLADLRLVTVLVGSDGRNSVAIMRDLATKEQYRRRAGESLGRMRVARIDPRQVVFTIEEFGYSRQEVLTYGDSTTMRTR